MLTGDRAWIIIKSMRNTLNVPLSGETQKWLESQAETEGFDTAAQLVRDLIEKKRAAEIARRKIDAALLEALASGPATPFLKSDLAKIKRAGAARVRQSKSRRG